MHYRDSVRLFLWADIKWLLFWVVSFTLLGSFFGYALYGCMAGLLMFILRQWQAMYLLHRWVRFHTTKNPPAVNGILSDLSKNFYQVHDTETRLRQALMNNIKRARESVSALNEAVVLIDSKNQIEWWNPAAEALLGLKRGDQGLQLTHLIRSPEFIQYFASANFEENLQLPSWLNPTKHYEIKITVFGDNDKLMIVSDITQLITLSKMRRDFVANVSHELRTPLTVFSGYIETFMQQDGLSPAWQRGFSQMQQQAFRMNSIVNDLLMLSQLENNDEQAAFDEINMPELLTQLFDDAQAYNHEYGHMIHLNIDSQNTLLGCRKEIHSALSNLVFNAIKYTPTAEEMQRQGHISINWNTDHEKAVFSVTDNGLGIAEKHLDRLTERFYRVDSGRSRGTGGTGLGLAIVKHVLFRHDAELTIESSEGEGSTFSAVFPTSRFIN